MGLKHFIKCKEFPQIEQCTRAFHLSQGVKEIDFLTHTEDFQSHSNVQTMSLTVEKLYFFLCEEFLMICSSVLGLFQAFCNHKFRKVAVASTGSGLRSLGSFGRCLVCAARRWGGGSVVWGIFGLQGFPLGSSLKTEQSATYCSLVFRVGLGELLVSHGITHWQPRFQPS